MNSGIPYFPLDCNLDDKFELIEAEFGLKGFAIVVKLFQRIYGGEGYYCEWTNDVGLVFSKSVGEGFSLVSEILSASINRGIFSKKLFDKYGILTSAGIQQRYLKAVERRKRIEMEKDYLLLKVDNLSENVYILSENVDISSKNVNISKQSKEEKSKEENTNNTGNDFSHRVPKQILDAWLGFVEMRSNNKWKLTNRAVSGILNKLNEYAPNNYEKQIQILDQSTISCWRDVFPLRQQKEQGQHEKSMPRGYNLLD